MDIFLARQAIYNKVGDVIAYELLFRNSYKNSFDNTVDSKKATYLLIKNMMELGINSLVDNKTAFINCDEKILNEDIITVLPKEKVVIEILEDVNPTESILRNISRLKEEGYKFALDDVVSLNGIIKFLRYVDYAKIDYRLTNKEERRKIISVLRKFGVMILAEKVETIEEVQEAFDLGCELYQGYYYSKPAIIKAKEIDFKVSSVTSLINQINSKDYNIDKIEKIMKSDVALMYKFMKFINSSSFGFVQEITSIKQAVMMVGREQLKKWIYLITFVDLNKGSNNEYTSRSIIRGKFCELIMSEINKDKKNDAFMVGVFSEIDLLLNDTIENAVKNIPVSDEIKDAIKGKKNKLRMVLELSIAYENMEVEKINCLSDKLSLANNKLSLLYLEAVSWGEELVV